MTLAGALELRSVQLYRLTSTQLLIGPVDAQDHEKVWVDAAHVLDTDLRKPMDVGHLVMTRAAATKLAGKVGWL